ncbi:hypothetical protein H7198_04065 [Fructobacillus sp. CRL 2054]|uniref:hypothetical protein n=1 Tax=Fructobacillus sp. CRL 2054 TaxID=2763007 RepID=UPI002378E2B3|nr:hypothetical protein [Fructobacillus sp. CRL 2054]MDD9138779.1 hypothetical protein [Fructobacillus sp. CRL 2054]
MADFTDPAFRKHLENLVEDLRVFEKKDKRRRQVDYSNKMDFHALRDEQSISFREQIILAINEDIKSKVAIRKRFSTFYIRFLSVVMTLTFYVILDPISMLLGRPSFYSDALKIFLVGTFFGTLFTAFMVMLKYGFTAEKQMLELFDLIGNESERG